MTEQMAEAISNFDELVARIATQPVEVLARAIAKQAATLGASIDWNGETTNQLSFYTGGGAPGIEPSAPERVLPRPGPLLALDGHLRQQRVKD